MPPRSAVALPRGPWCRRGCLPGFAGSLGIGLIAALYATTPMRTVGPVAEVGVDADGFGISDRFRQILAERHWLLGMPPVDYKRAVSRE